MKRSELFFTAILLPLDALAILAAYIIAYFWRSSGKVELYYWPFSEWLKISIPFLVIWLIIFSFQGLYRAKSPRRGWDEFSAIIIGTLYSWALFTVGLYFIRTEQTNVLPRRILIYLPFLAIFLIVAFRQTIHLVQRYLYRYGLGVRRVLLIGSENPITNSIGNTLQTNLSLGFRILNRVSPSHAADLSAIYSKTPFDEIIISNPNLPENQVLDIIHFCEDHNLGFRQVPNLFEVKSSRFQISTLNGTPIISLRHTPLEEWGHIAKRFLDIVGSIISIIIFSPIMLIVALIVKLDSSGPVIYRHKCIGLDGYPFQLLKFRTMRKEYCRGDQYGGQKAEEYFHELLKTPEFQASFKLKKDPRLTRIGSFLRRSNLDELPQLFNVLKGSLSLVGPRPIIAEEMERYGTHKYKRHIIKPGITGLWQVSGRNNISYEERIKLDLYYIENWSLWLDLSIIVRTLLTFIHKNTY